MWAGSHQPWVREWFITGAFLLSPWVLIAIAAWGATAFGARLLTRFIPRRIRGGTWAERSAFAASWSAFGRSWPRSVGRLVYGGQVAAWLTAMMFAPDVGCWTSALAAAIFWRRKNPFHGFTWFVIVAGLSGFLVLPSAHGEIPAWLIAPASTVGLALLVRGWRLSTRPDHSDENARSAFRAWIRVAGTAAAFVMAYQYVLMVMETPGPPGRVLLNRPPTSIAYRSLAETWFYDLAVDEDRDRLYFTSKVIRRVGVLDLATQRTTWSKTLVDGPERIAVQNDGGVTTYLKPDYPLSMTFDGDTMDVRRRCSLGYFVDITAYWEPGRLAAVEESHPGRLHVIDTENCSAELHRFELSTPYAARCAPSRRECYVTSWWYGSELGRLRDDGNSVTMTYDALGLGPMSMGLDIDAAESTLYVARPSAGTIDVIDLKSFKRTRRMAAPLFVRAVALADEHHAIVATSFFSGETWVMDAATGSVISSFRVGFGVRDVEWNARRQTFYFASRQGIVAAAWDDVVGHGVE